jgi:D-glycero-alpha-D-manno-heptose-7-phosphate kinase
MLLSKTPLRISFVGGGSDYFHHNVKRNGKVIVTTINKYIYTLLNNRYDNSLRLSYSITENVKNVNFIKHLLFKKTLEFFKIKNGIEIVTSSDIPSSGSGLGSSSALIVGLVNLFLNYKELKPTKRKLSEIASYIEINRCKKPIGFQDQYSTAFGGFNVINFCKNHIIEVNNLKISYLRESNFKNNLMLFYTGINRKADKILKKITNTKKHIEMHDKLVMLADNFERELLRGDIDNCGKIMNENWMLKRSLYSSVSSDKLDAVYNLALKNKVIGGKLLGAGGGGYFLFYIKKEHQKNLIKKLSNINIHNISFDFEKYGSQIIRV